MAAGWVSTHTGATLDAPTGVAELALRRNPRRAHLLVSLLLGKHVPVPGVRVLAAAHALGTLVRDACGEDPALVLGFAETATGLGHGVASVAAADGGCAAYAHTTRRPLPAGVAALAFAEEHSHAVDQTLGLRDDSALLDPSRPLVLVDDELSTGRTAVNAIRVLQHRWPRERYVLASLLDVRDDEQRAATREAVAGLGAELVDVSLARGVVHLPDDLLERAAGLVAVRAPTSGPCAASPTAAAPATSAAPASPAHPAAVRRWCLTLPAGTPLSAATGWDAIAEAGLVRATSLLADTLRPLLSPDALVLGDEEFLYPGQLVAAALDAGTSSTTRSPAHVVDADGYPLRSVLRFGATDDADRAAFAYNVRDVDDIVLVTDRPVRAELAEALAGAARLGVHLVQVESGTAPEPELS